MRRRQVMIDALVVGVAWSSCLREPQIHAFYYLWYGTPETDGRYLHWDHAVLPHWNPETQARWAHLANYSHEPPDHLHSPFYPALGPYSSRSRETLATHFKQMAAHGVDAAVLSWTGRPGFGTVSDTQGVLTDGAVAGAIAAAADAGVGAAIHLEPYHGRDPRSVRGDLEYLVTTYGESLFRLPARQLPVAGAPPSTSPCDVDAGRPLPVIYVYDAYHNSAEDWAELLCPGGAFSVRGTAFDVVAIATLLSRNDFDLVDRGCFDGFYTYDQNRVRTTPEVHIVLWDGADM